MAGRYGVDALSRFLSILGFVLLIIFIFTRIGLVFIIAVIALIWIYIRMLSRNHAGRSAENAKYLELRNRVLSRIIKTKNRISGSRYYKYYKCPGCARTLRVPKGRGRISIRCPKCGKEFTGKT